MAGLNFKGLDLVSPVNRIKAGMAAIAQNIRAYVLGGVQFRNLLSAPLVTLGAIPHTIKRLNDSTPNGPPGGFSLIIGAGTSLFVWNPVNGLKLVATGLSGNPLSMVPFRPNTSVQPWMYVADSAAQGAVTIITAYLATGVAVDFVTNGMIKVNANGVIYKMGVKEPQQPPVVSTTNTAQAFGGTGSLLATAIPWTNYLGQNSGFDYGETEGPPNVTPPVDGTAPFIVNCQNATSITITSLALDGTVVINGTTNPTLTATSAGRVTPGVPGFPGQFIQLIGSGGSPTTASYVVGAFTDGAGNVIPAGVAPLFIPNVVDVGVAFATSASIPVPFGAVAFQIGINSRGNTYTQGTPPNSGLITITGNVTTNALPTVTSILGNLSLAYFGDSPNSGGVASYLWRNPDDPGGSGPTRSVSDANGTANNNSFIFDATFTAGIPGLPGVGTDAVPMQWTTLTPDSVASGSIPVFPAPLTTTYPTQTTYANFNFCLTGNIFFPSAGNYTFVLTNHDDVIWGIGGGVKLVSATISGSGEGGTTGLSSSGQTITVVGGYPLLPRQNYTSGEGGDYAQTTVVVSVPAAGIYPIEIDYDYWFHSGRILLLEASATAGGSPTVIPPLPASVRQETQYRGVYRSSATGALSNPSPASAAETVPVSANTVTIPWSNDPQIDVWDLYRIDSVTDDYTYVATGPNDQAGPTIGGVVYNTPITDSLTDTQLGTQLIEEDNFEPFPSIDLPQKGTCSISGGVITWVSGGAIGGTATGFGLRWLGGTEILIGSPTSLAYTAVRRPTSTTVWDFTGASPEVPDATNVAYEIPEPALANQPLAYMAGPTDNINFVYANGDPLRPGTNYWCKGSNLDSAPDTNQEDVTDPGEPLVNVIMSSGRGVQFSIKRAWVIMPNFFNAQATATGTTGSTWTFQATQINRGLYMPRCLAVEGSGLIFFRVDDGIHVSPNGAASQSITDQDLYPLFPHENADGGTSVPQPITRQGVTIFPPNDALPQSQRFSIQNNYLYYDYQDASSTYRTLVFDISAMGWVWDVYTTPATIHASNEGFSTQGTLVGCTDLTIRQLESGGTESGTAILLSPAMGGTGWNHAREVIVEYVSTAPITLTGFAADSGNGSYGPQPITLPSTGGSLAKLKVSTGPTPNKWKLMWWMFTSTAPFTVNLEGFTVYVKPWGSNGPNVPARPFADSGGQG